MGGYAAAPTHNKLAAAYPKARATFSAIDISLLTHGAGNTSFIIMSEKKKITDFFKSKRCDI